MPVGIKRSSVVGISSSSVYSSLIGFSGWPDISGGKPHEIGFFDGTGGVFHRVAADANSWGDWERFAFYDSSGRVKDSDRVGGVAASYNNDASTLVARDANKYIRVGYINSDTPNTEDPGISQVIVTNGVDNFYRKASLTHFFGSTRYTDVFVGARNFTLDTTGHWYRLGYFTNSCAEYVKLTITHSWSYVATEVFEILLSATTDSGGGLVSAKKIFQNKSAYSNVPKIRVTLCGTGGYDYANIYIDVFISGYYSNQWKYRMERDRNVRTAVWTNCNFEQDPQVISTGSYRTKEINLD